MIFQFFCSLFVVTCSDVDGCLNLGPSDTGYHVHLVEDSTRVGVLLFAVQHRADESQPARNSCPRLPHSVRFGLYHAAVVLSFLRSSALHKFDSNINTPLNFILCIFLHLTLGVVLQHEIKKYIA